MPPKAPPKPQVVTTEYPIAGVGPTVKTPVGDAPVVPLILIGVGMYLAWFGVHYWRSDVKYPTDPIKDVLQGKGLPTASGTPTPAESTLESDLKTQQAQQASASSIFSSINAPLTGSSGTTGPTSSSANVNTGKLLAAAYGWGEGTTDWACLYSGWQEESGWSTTAANDPADPYNHAYGIPQANPGTKMAAAGADWKTDAATQIRWGLAYIKATYGAPSKVPGWTANGVSAGYVGY